VAALDVGTDADRALDVTRMVVTAVSDGAAAAASVEVVD
jgi:hypothetical protein